MGSHKTRYWALTFAEDRVQWDVLLFYLLPLSYTVYIILPGCVWMWACHGLMRRGENPSLRLLLCFPFRRILPQTHLSGWPGALLPEPSPWGMEFFVNLSFAVFRVTAFRVNSDIPWGYSPPTGEHCQMTRLSDHHWVPSSLLKSSFMEKWG